MDPSIFCFMNYGTWDGFRVCKFSATGCTTRSLASLARIFIILSFVFIVLHFGLSLSISPPPSLPITLGPSLPFFLPL